LALSCCHVNTIYTIDIVALLLIASLLCNCYIWYVHSSKRKYAPDESHASSIDPSALPETSRVSLDQPGQTRGQGLNEALSVIDPADAITICNIKHVKTFLLGRFFEGRRTKSSMIWGYGDNIMAVERHKRFWLCSKCIEERRCLPKLYKIRRCQHIRDHMLKAHGVDVAINQLYGPKSFRVLIDMGAHYCQRENPGRNYSERRSIAD